MLFIDEAYSLAGDQYGTESVDTLVKEMEDRRDDLVLIVAGYPDPMVVFIAQNPGLASRFRTTIEFADYTDDELVEIFRRLAAGADYDVTADCLGPVPDDPAGGTPRGPTFGNGRFARNLLEARHRPPRLAAARRDRADGRAAARAASPEDLDDEPTIRRRPIEPDAPTELADEPDRRDPTTRPEEPP